MKKFITRVFVGLYHWQTENWGKGELAVLTALIYLLMLQILNLFSALIIVQNVISFDIFGIIVGHLWIMVAINAILLIIDYLIVSPTKVTLEKNPREGKKITWIYLLATIVILAACIVWMVYNNEKG